MNARITLLAIKVIKKAGQRNKKKKKIKKNGEKKTTTFSAQVHLKSNLITDNNMQQCETAWMGVEER